MYEKGVQYYKVHTGQRFFIGNLEIEVMYTHEDLHPWSMMFFNNSSTVLRMTAHETDGNGNILIGSNTVDMIVLGDIQARASQMLRATFGDALKTDMVVLAHHGGNGAEAALYEDINARSSGGRMRQRTHRGILTSRARRFTCSRTFNGCNRRIGSILSPPVR